MKKRMMAALAAATVMFAAPAAAQVTFTGTSAGCFGAACAPILGASVNGGLTYTGSSFNQTTDNTGFLALGGTSDGLGTFTLTGLTDTYTGDIFRLLVSFTAPTSTPSNTTFETLLQGTVTGMNAGGVFVNFDNAVRTFASSAGPFTFALNDVSISSNSATQIVSGQIQAAVPEPGTWAMMLIGFGGMGVALRRRRSATMISQIA